MYETEVRICNCVFLITISSKVACSGQTAPPGGSQRASSDIFIKGGYRFKHLVLEDNYGGVQIKELASGMHPNQIVGPEHPSKTNSRPHIYQPLYLSTYLYTCLSTYQPLSLPVYLFTYQPLFSIIIPTYVPTSITTYKSTNLYFYLLSIICLSLRK